MPYRNSTLVIPPGALIHFSDGGGGGGGRVRLYLYVLTSGLLSPCIDVILDHPIKNGAAYLFQSVIVAAG